MVAPLHLLQVMRGLSSAALARRAHVSPQTVIGLIKGRRRGHVDTVHLLADSLDARYVVIPRDLTRPAHVEFLVAQLGLPPSVAARVRASLLAAARSAHQPPVPNPDGVRESRSFVE